MDFRVATSKAIFFSQSVRVVGTLGVSIAFLVLGCGPALPPGTKICEQDKDCAGGMVCAIKVCREACTLGPTGKCPTDEVCQPLPGGKAACVPTSVTNNNNNNQQQSKEGELCAKVPCQVGLTCSKSPQEQEFHCRVVCDPGSPRCSAEQFCGAITGGGGKGACFPLAKGGVDEFGKCGGTFGDCKQTPLKMVCVVDQKREPVHGYCLRECEADGSCRQGYHCIQSLKACAEDCDPAADKCAYGSCRRLSSMPDSPVCF